jgi:DNA-binding IclR family transcriptional regulator
LEKSGSGTDYNVRAVSRALTVLETFLDGSEMVSLADLSEITGIHRTTLLRICSSLEQRGFLRRDEVGRYRLGAAIFRLGQRFESDTRLHELVVPAMHELLARVNESVSFHVRSGDSRLCLFRLESDHSLVDNVKVGSRFPIERGAPGKVIAAYSDKLSSEDAERIRKEGHAISVGERDPECAAIAAPVFGFGNCLLGALSISGPKIRLSQERLFELVPHLKSTVLHLSDQFGGRLPSNKDSNTAGQSRWMDYYVQQRNL